MRTNLLPVNVDDMSSRITPSVNVDDTQCNLGLQQVGVKENYKENNKEIVFFSRRLRSVQYKIRLHHCKLKA